MTLPEVDLRHNRNGVPFVRISLGVNKVTGKRIQRYKEFPGMTDDEARLAAEAWEADVRRSYVGGVSDRLGDQIERYISYMEIDGRSYNTVASYRTYANYCKPIERTRVRDVTPTMLNDLFTLLLTEGPHGTPLAHTTVYGFKMFLQGAYRHFKKIGLVVDNPVRDSMKIIVDSPEGVALDEEALRKLNEWVERHLDEVPTTTSGVMTRNVAFAIYLALYTGARVGEVCALRRCDIRTMQRTVNINGTVVFTNKGLVRQNKTKGKKSRNVTVLERNIKRINEHIRWQDGYLASHNSKTPIITCNGKHMTPSLISHRFTALCRELGLDPAYHFHTLRHTHATWLLQGGCDMRTIQERLGHSRVDITLRLYSHVMPGRDAQAAEGFGAVMDGITG